MIPNFLLPALILSPVVYILIFRIKNNYLSLVLGNLIWILILVWFNISFRTNGTVGLYAFYYFWIGPIIILSLSLSFIRLAKNYQFKQD